LAEKGWDLLRIWLAGETNLGFSAFDSNLFTDDANA